jgi:hypothetical protein
MSLDYAEELGYDYEADFDDCRRCRRKATGQAEIMPCQFCGKSFETGKWFYRCLSCNKEWQIGRRKNSFWGEKPVCSDCLQTTAGNCEICGNPTTVANSQKTYDLTFCTACLNVPVAIWCPTCSRNFPYKGYLKGAFHRDIAGLHAAALVTHYRHHHVRSHDAACQSQRYASKIPGYHYDEYKAKVNNQAMRQLIRAIKKHVKYGTYPVTAPVVAHELVEAFGILHQCDGPTQDLIEKVLAELGEAPPDA